MENYLSQMILSHRKNGNQVDSMVLSWILNSISEDLVEAFLYTTTAHELRSELEQQFRESNGPLLY